MFKKLLPLIVVLALLAACSGYRAVSAQAIGAENSPNDGSQRYTDLYAPAPGFEYWQLDARRLYALKGAIKAFTNLSTGDIQRAKSAALAEHTDIPAGELQYAQRGARANNSRRSCVPSPLPAQTMTC